MARFPCPHLDGEVELSEERQRHIAERHPELLPAHLDRVSQTLADPDVVRRSAKFGDAHLFSRWYDDVRTGKHVVVVVVSRDATPARHWIVTAYLARKLAEGGVEWERS